MLDHDIGIREIDNALRALSEECCVPPAARVNWASGVSYFIGGRRLA
jgi:hypothetical protein